MSGDPEQEYFADGMVEEIITALSRIRWLFVIARNSSFMYKCQAIDMKQVGRELGVRYVLEGSVRKAAQRVRITAQLIDATTATPRFERIAAYVDAAIRLGAPEFPCGELLPVACDRLVSQGARQGAGGRACQEITVEEYVEGRGEEARVVKRTKFKLHDKLAALLDLGRHVGLFPKAIR
jgi:hypothetical protein